VATREGAGRRRAQELRARRSSSPSLLREEGASPDPSLGRGVRAAGGSAPPSSPACLYSASRLAGRRIEDLRRRIEEFRLQIDELRLRIEGVGEDGRELVLTARPQGHRPPARIPAGNGLLRVARLLRLASFGSRRTVAVRIERHRVQLLSPHVAAASRSSAVCAHRERGEGVVVCGRKVMDGHRRRRCDGGRPQGGGVEQGRRRAGVDEAGDSWFAARSENPRNARGRGSCCILQKFMQ
jgi:hypothetical protein